MGELGAELIFMASCMSTDLSIFTPKPIFGEWGYAAATLLRSHKSS
jgi:hypothetical protein